MREVFHPAFYPSMPEQDFSLETTIEFVDFDTSDSLPERFAFESERQQRVQEMGGTLLPSDRSGVVRYRVSVGQAMKAGFLDSVLAHQVALQYHLSPPEANQVVERLREAYETRRYQERRAREESQVDPAKSPFAKLLRPS